MSGQNLGEGDGYIGNIWGRKWTIISLIIIVAVILLAVIRYAVVQPERLIEPDKIEDFG